MGYSWDDDSDFDDSKVRGFSYHSARRSYDDVAVAKAAGRAHFTFREPPLVTDSVYPIVVGIDTTGSMQSWPRTFFEKLPLLYTEAVKYLPGCEISFQAINDFWADGSEVALQPAPFGSGPKLDEYIGQLYPVGGGGGQSKESYEIFAAYNSLLTAPKALIKPIAIILGDEAPFEQVPEDVASHYGFEGAANFSCEQAFLRLHDKCDTYLVHKRYPSSDDAVLAAWRSRALMPAERILTIEDPARVVDVILGVLGIITGKVEMFETELASRQNAQQVTQVLRSLHGLAKTKGLDAGLTQKSMPTGLNPGGGKSKGLDLDA